MRKRMNLGLWFTIAVGGWFMFKQMRAAKAAQAVTLLPSSISTSVDSH